MCFCGSKDGQLSLKSGAGLDTLDVWSHASTYFILDARGASSQLRRLRTLKGQVVCKVTSTPFCMR